MNDPDINRLRSFILAKAQGDLLPCSAQLAAAELFNISLNKVEETALELGLLPARYQRNRQAISTLQQLKLFRSRAVIIGCGGLGGYVVEELARLGVGNLVLIDSDVIEEHNLNRQILSTAAVLNRPKVDVAFERVRTINPAVNVTPLKTVFFHDNGRELVQGADVVIDGLDTIPDRLELAQICHELSIPVVHGAIGGWYGQVATQLPGENISPQIFGMSPPYKGIETDFGNPSFTPAVIASFQVAEACKILLREGRCLNKRILFINLLDMEIVEVKLTKQDF
ncbi:MAG TPA: HesA/MoeB/ThiF family protein [Geobacteraceae bacterium]|nr:HesA/MoeB/ThiF family protein [Geobacteraceae bacterium]